MLEGPALGTTSSPASCLRRRSMAACSRSSSSASIASRRSKRTAVLSMSVIDSLPSLCMHNCSTPKAACLTQGRPIGVGPWLCRVWSSENSMHANFSELRQCEVRRIHLPRTRVNKGKKEGRSPSDARTPAWWFSLSDVVAPATSSRFLGGENHLHRVRVCGISEHIVGVHDLVELEVVGAKDRRIQTPFRNQL